MFSFLCRKEICIDRPVGQEFTNHVPSLRSERDHSFTTMMRRLVQSRSKRPGLVAHVNINAPESDDFSGPSSREQLQLDDGPNLPGNKGLNSLNKEVVYRSLWKALACR